MTGHPWGSHHRVSRGTEGVELVTQSRGPRFDPSANMLDRGAEVMILKLVHRGLACLGTRLCIVQCLTHLLAIKVVDSKNPGLPTCMVYQLQCGTEI